MGDEYSKKKANDNVSSLSIQSFRKGYRYFVIGLQKNFNGTIPFVYYYYYYS